MVRGLPLIEQPTKICEGCILGKQHRNVFPSGKSWRERAPLELIHSDLCGPMQTPSLGKSQYFITFIDDFSRKTWVYFLKYKSEAFEIFKQFKALVEKQSGHYIKVLRTDRGGEYISNEFLNFCKEHGIKKQFTTRYTPQQNGVAERKNRTIQEMARSMLKAKGLSNEFWGEAVATAIYLLNRCPTKSVCNMIPQEAWSKKNPSVEHLRVFGCVAFAHIPKERRQKWDDKGEKCIFIGYSEQSKAYKLYNPKTKELIINRDVIFLEDEAWNDQQGTTQDVGATIPPMELSNGTQGITTMIPQSIGIQHGAQGVTQVTPPSTSSQVSPQETPPTGTPSTKGRTNPSSSRYHGNDSSRKTRSLKEIYETSRYEDDDNELVNFSLFSEFDPIYFEDVVKERKWCDAMDEEMQAIEKNETWELVNLPTGK
jgi:hypothetical protein